jgi:hypothetical protein
MGKKLPFVALFFWFRLHPLFNQEFIIFQFEAHLDEYRVCSLEREHAVFRQVFRQIDQVFAVLSPEQSSSSFTNQ